MTHIEGWDGAAFDRWLTREPDWVPVDDDDEPEKEHWKILGRYRGQVELIDEACDGAEAEILVVEYGQAFGPDWFVWRVEP